MALTALAIQKFPKLSILGGVILSSFEVVDITLLEAPNPRTLANDSISGRARMRAAQRGILFITIAYLLKNIGSIAYLRNTTLAMGSLKILGNLAGAGVSGFAACCLFTNLVELHSNAPTESAGLWLGIWHHLPPGVGEI